MKCYNMLTKVAEKGRSELMKRYYSWSTERGKILSIKKWRTDFGSLHIKAVLELKERNNDEVETRKLTILWAFSPVVHTSDKIRGNLAPACFQWAYENAEEGMEVVVHHSLDDNNRYFYYC